MFGVIDAIDEGNIVVKVTCERMGLRKIARLKQKGKFIYLKVIVSYFCVSCVSHS